MFKNAFIDIKIKKISINVVQDTSVSFLDYFESIRRVIHDNRTILVDWMLIHV